MMAARGLKRYFGNKMSVGAQMVIVLKAFHRALHAAPPLPSFGISPAQCIEKVYVIHSYLYG
jgi:hypothetical protein